MTTATYTLRTDAAFKGTPAFDENPPADRWGGAEGMTVKVVAEGIEWLRGTRHGGFRLSRERWLRMPENLRYCSFTGDQFFEEDCSLCAVILAFPEEFPADDVAKARETFRQWYGWVYDGGRTDYRYTVILDPKIALYLKDIDTLACDGKWRTRTGTTWFACYAQTFGSHRVAEAMAALAARQWPDARIDAVMQDPKP